MRKKRGADRQRKTNQKSCHLIRVRSSAGLKELGETRCFGIIINLNTHLQQHSSAQHYKYLCMRSVRSRVVLRGGVVLQAAAKLKLGWFKLPGRFDPFGGIFNVFPVSVARLCFNSTRQIDLEMNNYLLGSLILAEIRFAEWNIQSGARLSAGSLMFTYENVTPIDGN